MAKLYFMDREFSGVCWSLREMVDDVEFHDSMVFQESWHFLYYCFFARDQIHSETSDTVRTHLYNLASVLYRDFEAFTKGDPAVEESHAAEISEIVEIAEYSAAFPVCLWIYGDETSKEFLDEWMAPLPSPEQMAHVLKLPHVRRAELDRMPHRHSEPKLALKRYRNALADFNRRRKLAAKNKQRAQPPAGAGPDAAEAEKGE